MFDQGRVVNIHPSEDQARWTLADTEAYQCPRCKLQLVATFTGCTVEQEPYLMCANCLEYSSRRVIMKPITPPKDASS